MLISCLIDIISQFELILHFVRQQAIQFQMLNNQIAQQILKVQKDLRFVKCQTAQVAELPLPSICGNVCDLLKVLKMKNRQICFKQTKQTAIKERQLQQKYNNTNFEILDAKIWQQKQRVIVQLHKNKKKEKHNALYSYDLLKNLQSKDEQNSKIGIYDYLDLLGCNQQIKICKQFKISNDFNKQKIQDLAQCFRHLANISQPIKRLQKQQKTKYSIQNITRFKQMLLEMCKIKSQNQGNINFFNFWAQAQLNNSFSKTVKNIKMFNFVLNLFKQHSKQSPYNPNKMVLVEGDRIFKSMSFFIRDQRNQKKFMKQALNQSQFWQKICFLFSKGHEEYQLLQYHLKYKQQFSLLQHFNNVVVGKQSSFQPKLTLFSNNQFYRQFIMLLQAKYLAYCINNGKLPQAKMIYVALREISILSQQNKSNQSQIDYLKKVTSKIVYQFKTSLIINQSQQTIKRQINELFTLGQYNIVLQLLFDYNKLQTMQFLLLLSILHDFDVKHSNLLLYNHSKTTHTHRKLLQNIVISTQSNMEEVFSLISAFLPTTAIKNAEEQSFISNLLIANKKFFQYSVQIIGIIPALQALNLSPDAIANILSASIMKHQNYMYCFQLALGSSFDLLQIYKLFNSNAGKQKKSLSNMTDPVWSCQKGRQFQLLNLNIFLNTSKQLLCMDKRFNIFLEAYEMLIKININLLKDLQLRQRKYEEVSFLNELSTKIVQTQLCNMWTSLQVQDHRIIQNYKSLVKQHANMLILTYNMVRIKISIGDRKYEYIVQVLNSLFQCIAEHFNATVYKLQLIHSQSQIKDVLIIFIADVVQSILILKQFKPKVIDRNRIILNYVCRVAYEFLVQIKTKQAQAKVIFKQLQQIMSELNGFAQN